MALSLTAATSCQRSPAPRTLSLFLFGVQCLARSLALLAGFARLAGLLALLAGFAHDALPVLLLSAFGLAEVLRASARPRWRVRDGASVWKEKGERCASSTADVVVYGLLPAVCVELTHFDNYEA